MTRREWEELYRKWMECELDEDEVKEELLKRDVPPLTAIAIVEEEDDKIFNQLIEQCLEDADVTQSDTRSRI